MILTHEQLKNDSTAELLADIAYHERLATMILPDPQTDWIREWNQAFIDAIRAEIKLREAE